QPSGMVPRSLLVKNKSDQNHCERHGEEQRHNDAPSPGETNSLNLHATFVLKILSSVFSGSVAMPSLEIVLMIGKLRVRRFTPPVAVSASAAVSSARIATTTASFSFSLRSGFSPQLF